MLSRKSFFFRISCERELALISAVLLCSDTLSWGDLTVENQTFVLCDTMAEVLNVMPIDGIMGSKYPSTFQSSKKKKNIVF